MKYFLEIRLILKKYILIKKLFYIKKKKKLTFLIIDFHTIYVLNGILPVFEIN